MEILVNVDLNDIKEQGTYYLKPVEQEFPEPLFLKREEEWISVKDKMPNAPQACWIKNEIDGVIAVGLYQPRTQSWEFYPPMMTFTLNYVTHWAPVILE